MKYARLLLIISILYTATGCQQRKVEENAGKDIPAMSDTVGSRQQIADMLDSFNRAAAAADYNGYFTLFTDDAVFCGTDAAERWNKPAFMAWAKPFFDKKKAWSFTAIQRHISLDKSGDIAWFDELLNTQMRICRGSGVVVKENGSWKVAQYVLSAAIPNSLMDSVVALKAKVEDSTISVLRK